MENILKSKNADTVYYDLYEEKIEPCRGCCGCYKNGLCFISDDLNKILLKINESDGIIIGSPTYACNVSGTLKNFIDRGNFIIGQLLKGKYAMSVITYENYGGSDAEKILNKILKYSGAYTVDSLTVKIPFNCNNLSDFDIDKKTDRLVRRFYDSVEERKKYLFQGLKHRVVFEVGIKPFVVKKGKSYTGVLNHWKKVGLMK